MLPTMAIFIVNASALRLRESPQLSSAVLGALPRGTRVEVLSTSDDGRWSQVESDRRIGWMASKYLVPADHPVPPQSSEEFPWMAIASSELGVKEQPGLLSNARVLEYLASTELDKALAATDETPWCSGFVNWCVEKSGIAGSNSAAARSWLDWGRPLVRPRRGAIVVLKRGANNGHVAFFLSRSQNAVLTLLGGNQANAVSVAQYDEDRLLGYRVPHF